MFSLSNFKKSVNFPLFPSLTRALCLYLHPLHLRGLIQLVSANPLYFPFSQEENCCGQAELPLCRMWHQDRPWWVSSPISVLPPRALPAHTLGQRGSKRWWQGRIREKEGRGAARHRTRQEHWQSEGTAYKKVKQQKKVAWWRVTSKAWTNDIL